MHEKKIPMRKCTGCGEMKPKKELIRVVRSPEGAISLDATGKSSGRGVYICRSAECLKKARKSNALSRSLDDTGKKPGRGAYLCPNKACLAKARKGKRLERAFEVQIPDAVYDEMNEKLS